MIGAFADWGYLQESRILGATNVGAPKIAFHIPEGGIAATASFRLLAIVNFACLSAGLVIVAPVAGFLT